MKLKITTPSTDIFTLLLPSAATFELLHAALEIIFHKKPNTYYSFMLMTDRCAIEARGAEEQGIAAAFAGNPVICYYNPYPGEEKYKLELLDAEAAGSELCPVIQGTAEDGMLNQQLREFCMFTDGWVRRSPEAENRKTSKGKGRLGIIRKAADVGLFRLKKFDEKLSFLKYMMIVEEDLRFRIDGSSCSQAELLENEWTKDQLQTLCRDMGLPVKTNWRKQKLAESSSEFLRENIWMVMLIFTKPTIEFYLRLCRMKKGQRYRADRDLDRGMIELLLYWGFADLAVEPETKVPVLELAEDMKHSFLKGYGSNLKYDGKSSAAAYLSPEMKTGSWQKVIQGYEKLDSRALKLLQCFGIIPFEQMCTDMKRCYGYRFTEEEWKRYMQMHLEPFGLLEIGIHNQTGEHYAALRGIDLNKARQNLNMYPVEPVQKPVDRDVVEETEERISQWYQELRGFLKSYVEEEDMSGIVVCEIEASVAGNNSWGEVLLALDDLLDCLSEEEKVLLWYPLSRLYLRYPVSGLGGYTRIEYAEKHQIENPYTVLNDPDNNANWLRDNIYGMPFGIQWKLFTSCERLMMKGDDLSEYKMRNCAKKALGTELADVLLVYCYLQSGNPKLLELLHKWEEEGDAGAREVLEELMWMMENLDERAGEKPGSAVLPPPAGCGSRLLPFEKTVDISHSFLYNIVCVRKRI